MATVNVSDLGKYLALVVLIGGFIADAAVGQYRIEQNHKLLTDLKAQLSPAAYQDYAVLKKTVLDLEKDMSNVQGRLWKLEINE